MLELSSSGSVRGVSSNGHPYRDPRSTAAGPVSCGNRQQWVVSGPSPRRIKVSGLRRNLSWVERVKPTLFNSW
jgi:hypothetical protein